jgi:SAM-dependent methyltransferase
MPVLRVNNYVDAYRLRSQSEDIHEMAARPDKKALTEWVNRQILDAIQPGPDDFLVDIGCGDATLLRMAAARTGKCIGIAGSVEEQRRLKSAFPDLIFEACQAQSLPFKSGIASKVVCNATLHYLASESEVAAALREMARIARPGATVWVGEIPATDEYDQYGMYRGTSMTGLLLHVLRHNGIRSFFGMLRRWLKAVVGNQRIVLNSAGIFWAEPDKMLALAESNGLRLKTYFRHKELDGDGKVVDSKFRYDYVFTV